MNEELIETPETEGMVHELRKDLNTVPHYISKEEKARYVRLIQNPDVLEQYSVDVFYQRQGAVLNFERSWSFEEKEEAVEKFKQVKYRTR